MHTSISGRSLRNPPQHSRYWTSLHDLSNMSTCWFFQLLDAIVMPLNLSGRSETPAWFIWKWWDFSPQYMISIPIARSENYWIRLICCVLTLVGSARPPRNLTNVSVSHLSSMVRLLKRFQNTADDTKVFWATVQNCGGHPYIYQFLFPYVLDVLLALYGSTYGGHTV